MCRSCYQNKGQQRLVLTLAQPTTRAQRHLQEHGFDLKGNTIEREASKRQLRVEDQLLNVTEKQKQAQDTVFNHDDWRRVFIRWIVADDVSLRKSVSLAHKELLVYRNPILEPVIPINHQTSRNWLLGSFHHSKAASLCCTA